MRFFRKILITFFCFLATGLILGAFLFSIIFVKEESTPIFYVNDSEISVEKSLAWNNSMNLRQSYNACGPYSAAAYLSVINKSFVNPEQVNLNMEGRLQNNTTYPYGVAGFLTDKHEKAYVYFTGFLSPKDRMNFIRKKISSGYPAILLVKMYGVLHYITVLGYDNSHFYIYDSMQKKSGSSKYTVDFNGTHPGNIDIEINQLYKYWSDVKIKKIRPYLIISAAD